MLESSESLASAGSGCMVDVATSVITELGACVSPDAVCVGGCHVAPASWTETGRGGSGSFEELELAGGVFSSVVA
jgi:hypothetical protein